MPKSGGKLALCLSYAIVALSALVIVYVSSCIKEHQAPIDGPKQSMLPKEAQ